jgi:hypothetical protein
MSARRRCDPRKIKKSYKSLWVLVVCREGDRQTIVVRVRNPGVEVPAGGQNDLPRVNRAVTLPGAPAFMATGALALVGW